MTPLTKTQRAAVLRAAGRQAKRDGQSFEDAVTLALSPLADVCLARCHPETKVLPDGRGARRVVYVRKNGVDFVGTAHGRAVALEVKRLPGAASLRASQANAVRAEAGFLRAFVAAGGAAAFLVLDPDLERLYVVRGAAAFDAIATGGLVTLRTRDGGAVVPYHAVGNVTLVTAIRAALREVSAC